MKKESVPKGGKRPGAGRPKGSKSKATIGKEQAREYLRQRVIEEMGPMLDAQIKHARGIRYMMVRNKKGGKWTRLTEEMATRGYDAQTEVVEVFEKDPSIQAFTDLMNRALDKPVESLEANVRMPGVDGLVERLLAARKRVAGRES